MILFSVLMSVYKNDDPTFLSEALESLLTQTLVPNEIVLVIDGEISNELNKVVESYKNKLPLIVHKLPFNMGLGNALFEGLKLCKFDYVARMDSDDISIQNRFEIQIQFLKKNIDVDVLGGYCLEFDHNDTNFSVIKNVPQSHVEIIKLSRYKNPLNHVTVIFKRDAVLKSGSYNSDHPLMEDYSLWVKMLANGYVFHNLNIPLVKVRVGLDMINRRRGLKYLKYDIDFQKFLLRSNHINYLVFVFNLIIRFTLRLAPVSILQFVYFSILRSKNIK